MQSDAHGTECQWEYFKALVADSVELQEDVQGVERCIALSGVFHSWVGVAVRWSLASLASARPS